MSDSLRRARPAALATLLAGLLVAGCVGPDGVDPETGLDLGERSADEAFLIAGRGPDAIADGSDQARAVLRAANLATPEELADPKAIGLLDKPRARLLAYRAGADGVWGTADDRALGTLAELDAIPWVGTRTFQRLLAWGTAQGYATPRTCAAAVPRGAGPAALVVEPDDGTAPVVALLTGARRTIDVVVYQLSSKEVLAALEAAAARGVRVRVIVDRQQAANPALVTRLQAAGIAAKLSSAVFIYTHQKTVLVDGRTAFVFTGNLDYLSLRSARNYGVLDTAWQDVDDLTALFEADWAGVAPALDCTRLVVAPENARGRVLAALAAAQHTIDVEALYVTDAPIVDALLAAHDRGVAVRVLINDPDFGFGSDVTGKKLVAAGVPARRTGTLFVHAKVLVLDGQTVYLGSENFSQNSLLRNREVGVLLGPGDLDPGRVVAAFEADWARSQSF